jgi:aminobenzoyl-glutamate utilization protein B
VACIGSSIGEKGILYASQVLAVTTLDLLERPELVTAARVDFETRMKDRQYTTLIPKGQKVPAKIR